MCPLCKQDASKPFYNKTVHIFYECLNCEAIYRSEESCLSSKKEHERYLTHNNDIEDLGYQNFVMPLVNQVEENFDSNVHKGLDYGAGPGPVITKLLNDKNFELALFDPYFWPNTSVLEATYDFIICCEVMEHFNKPNHEFKKLRGLLKKGGQLICKTSLYNKEIDFSKWYYKDDPTHVIIYGGKSLDWISDNLNFTRVSLKNGIIVFEG